MKKKLSILITIILLCAASSTPVLASGPERVAGVLERAPASYLTESPALRQCELGSTAADAVRAAAGTQVALVNTGDLAHDLNRGTVTEEDARRVFREDRPLAVAELTPAQLWELLEHAVHQVTVDLDTERVDAERSTFEGFCQISGFQFRYDASAPPGERIVSVTLDSGERLSSSDEATVLTAAAARFMLEGGYGYPALQCQPLECTLSEALAEYVAVHPHLPEGKTERIDLIGARENVIVGGVISPGMLLGGCLILMVMAAGSGYRLRRYRDEAG